MDSPRRRVSAATNGQPGKKGIANPHYDSVQATSAWKSFQQFYPYYLGHHRMSLIRRMHLIGTTISIGLLLKGFMQALVQAVSAHRLRREQKQQNAQTSPAGVGSAGSGVGPSSSSSSSSSIIPSPSSSLPFAITRAVAIAFFSLFRGYVLAWASRLLLNRLRGGTDPDAKVLRQHPFWCLLGDLRMWWEVMTMQRAM